jgi:WD40 repeat protein
MKKPIFSLAAVLATVPFAGAADLDFYRDVYPFLKSNCISCHNKTTTKAGLNMESPELLLKGGDSGPALVPGKGEDSLVVAASKHLKDMEMPPPNNKSGAQNLTAAEIATLRLWIDQGAKSSVKQEHTVVWQPLAPGVDPIYTVAMTRDGRFAVCGRGNQIFIYDLATRQCVGQIADPAEKPGTAHRALVQSLAFSPDGTRLASGSYREVKIWRLEKAQSPATTAQTAAQPASEELLKKLAPVAKAAITSSAMSADGKRVAAGCADGSVRVWDVASLNPVAELRGNVTAAKNAAELDWIIAAQTLEQAFQKSEVARMDAQNKALDELLKKANDAIAAMKKVLPEKQKAVPPATEAKTAAQKAVDDLQAQIAKAPDGKPDAALTKQFKDAEEKLQGAAMTERSALAAVSAAQSNVDDADADVKRITESKAKNAQATATANAAIEQAKKAQDKATADLTALKQSVAKATTKPVAVSFSADAHRVAAVFEDNALVVWAVASGTPIEQAASEAVASTTLATAPDGSFVASKSATVSTGAAPRWVLERTLGGVADRTIFADRVNAVRFSPDGKTLATGGGELTRSGDIILFDVASGKVTQTWKERHADTVLCLDFSPDGKLLASGAADKIARVTEVATGKQTNAFEGHTHHVTGIAFRSDGRVLATAGAEGVVNTWDMIVGERKKKIEGWSKEVTSLEFIGATAQIITSAGDNRVRIVTDDGAEVRAIAKLPDYVQAAASTPSGSTIVGGGEDSQLRVWDGTSGKELAVFGTK